MEQLPESMRAFWARQIGVDVAAEAAEAFAYVERVCGDWQIERGLSMSGGGVVSLVYLAERAGQECVLKVAPRFAGWSPDEAQVLALWAGNGAVRLIGSSLDGRALLLERLDQGRRVRIDEIAGLLARLHGRDARGAALPAVSQRIDEEFTRARRHPHAPVTGRLLRRCHRVAQEICAAVTCPVLVHGDLQQKNLMWRGNDPVIIDPIPAVGEPLYDVVLWSLTEPPHDVADSRSAEVAALLGHDPARARRLCRAMSAAVAIWSPDPRVGAAMAALAQTIDDA